MGRAQLQGTPWHYEYAKGKGINNSKNCVFNTGEKCTCKISTHHHYPCVGKLDCEEFERSSFRRTGLNKSSKKVISTQSKPLPQNKLKPTLPLEKIVELGNEIIVKAQDTAEETILNIGDNKNPFYLKILYDTVLIKGRKYKIIKINKP